MGNLVAYDRGDPRAIWVMLDGRFEELTPLEDGTVAAGDMVRALGQRFWLKRCTEGWTVYDTQGRVRTFPTKDAAIMWAVHRG